MRVYVSALTQGLTRSITMKQSIADARLRMDYARLSVSGIAFDKKYFRYLEIQKEPELIYLIKFRLLHPHLLGIRLYLLKTQYDRSPDISFSTT
jgi:hypothetical protein